MAQKIVRARWFFDRTSWVPTVDELTLALSSIQQSEKDRVAKYVFYKDAIASLTGRLLIRKFVSEAVGLPWSDIVVDRDQNEKPCFSSNVSVQFNVSHHGKFTVFAGETSGAKVGVDIMETKYTGGKELVDFLRTMSRQFSKQEWEKINESSSPSQQEKTFFRLWSLKESYIKATGVGLRIPLKDLDFRIKSPLRLVGGFVEDTELHIAGCKQEDWTFQEVLIDDNYCACVAIHCPSVDLGSYPCIPFKEIMANDLLKSCMPVIPADVVTAHELLVKYHDSKNASGN